MFAAADDRVFHAVDDEDEAATKRHLQKSNAIQVFWFGVVQVPLCCECLPAARAFARHLRLYRLENLPLLQPEAYTES